MYTDSGAKPPPDVSWIVWPTPLCRCAIVTSRFGVFIIIFYIIFLSLNHIIILLLNLFYYYYLYILFFLFIYVFEFVLFFFSKPNEMEMMLCLRRCEVGGEA